MINTWSDVDFESMDWHDNSLYSISFPTSDLTLKLDIDYILEWKLEPKTNLYEFIVAPALLVFDDVMNLNIKLQFGNSIGLYIDKISKANKKLSLNGKVYIWDYIIETDKGEIIFEATGFTQKLNAVPKRSTSQRFDR